jgi:hypothetical protein
MKLTVLTIQDEPDGLSHVEVYEGHLSDEQIKIIRGDTPVGVLLSVHRTLLYRPYNKS